MKRKYMFIVALVVALTLSSLAFEAYACGCGSGKGKACSNFENKFSKKVSFICKNKEELGVSDKQLEKLKYLKLSTKKELIKNKAEIDILVLDIKSEMYNDKIDTNVVDKLIDEKYEFKKAKAKLLVNAYAEIKVILTDEQKEKMEVLWKKCEDKKKCITKCGKNCKKE